MEFDEQYDLIASIGIYLGQFKRIGDVFNFRCPYCGDSTKNKRKARGYLYKRKDTYAFKCHNCGQFANFNSFIKEHFPGHYSDFLLDKYRNTIELKNLPTPLTDLKLLKTKKLFLPYICELSNNHPAKRYLLNRKIPEVFFDYLYYAEDYAKTSNNLLGYEKYLPKNTTSRVVIPFYTEDKELIGFQGRVIGNHKCRYLTTMLKDTPSIFGLDRLDKEQQVWVVEGPLDSLFLKNSIALTGASRKISFDNAIYVYDNEPDNKEICSQILNKIEDGYKVVIWPKNIKEKDINDLVLAGIDPLEVLEENVYQGILARIKYYEWKGHL